MTEFTTQHLDGPEAIAQAVDLLVDGQCVALPTETVYGLAADASHRDAVDRIFAAKGRPKNHPLIVHIPDVTHLARWAVDIPTTAYDLAKEYWPGPLTFLLRKRADVTSGVTGGLNTIALRVPSHPKFLAVLKAFDGGLAAPSANLYKQLSPTMSSHVMKGLSGRIAAVLEGGQCEHGVESTIVDLVSGAPRILRAGPITKAQLEQSLGTPVAMPQAFDDVVPGNVEAHYQPKTPLVIGTESYITNALSHFSGEQTHLLVWSDTLAERCLHSNLPSQQWHHLPNDAPGFASMLYASLDAIDQLGAGQIIVEQPPDSDDWRAVNDRLTRAASETR